MRSMLRTLLFVPAALITAGSALAATATLNVPFDFTANGKICPAGIYRVDTDIHGNTLSLKGRNAPVNFVWVMVPGDGDPQSRKVNLQFDQIGQNFELRNVQYGAMTTPRLDRKHKHSEEAPARIVQGD